MYQSWKIKFTLILNYFLFAILLNSVGTIILQTIAHFHVTKSHAANLDAYKDITIAVFSFIVGMILPRLGYKNGLLAALAIIGTTCFLVPLVNQLWIIKLLLISTGVSFALIKIASYATVSLIAEDENSHASFISYFEGIFMIGSLAGLWLFGFFVRSPFLLWTQVFWVLSAIAIVGFMLTLTMSLDSSHGKPDHLPTIQDNLKEMLHLIKEPVVLLFIGCIFMYVFVEQGLLTWLPTFNHLVLNIDQEMSIEMTSLLSAAIAIGRISAGVALKRFYWFWFTILLLCGSMLMVIFLVPQASPTSGHIIHSWHNISWVGFILPLIGIFIAPIYPIMCSTLISALPEDYQSGMMGLILVFSAVGGSTGSKIIGLTFGLTDGPHAISVVLIPLGLLLVMVFPYRYLRESGRSHLIVDQNQPYKAS